MILRRAIAALALALVVAPAATAAEPQVYRLSAAEIERAKAAAALRTDTDTQALLPDPERDRRLATSLYADAAPRDRKLHGEVGMFIGSGGARGVFGSIGAPLGDDGLAQFSFDTGRYPARQLQPYRWQQQRR
jgi:hypothetical protein